MKITIKDYEFDYTPMSAYQSIEVGLMISSELLPLLEGVDIDEASKNPMSLLSTFTKLDTGTVMKVLDTILKRCSHETVPVDLKLVNWRGKLDVLLPLALEAVKAEYSPFLESLGVNLGEIQEAFKAELS